LSTEIDQEITRLLRHWSRGDDNARDRLLSVVYDRLHRLANQQFSRERDNHTLQATALVHEAFISLDAVDIDWQGRDHFYALVAQVMRRLLVDHARSRSRLKRGGDRLQVELEDSWHSEPAPSADLLALDDALNRLAAQSERIARTLELTYFGGLTQEQVADVVGVSRRTVDRDLKLGRAWLKSELAEG
jgi:RNA polymerase sigma factor (TIGR02999 family)